MSGAIQLHWYSHYRMFFVRTNELPTQSGTVKHSKEESIKERLKARSERKQKSAILKL